MTGTKPVFISRGDQAAIDGASHDGEGWAVRPDLPAGVRDRLSGNGLIRYWKGRWQLTPEGFARTKKFAKADG